MTRTPTPLNVLLVTTWNTACGIAEHSSMLKEAVERVDPGITITPSVEALDPAFISHAGIMPDVVHLNYQAALHSRWTPERIALLRRGFKILVTFHDTGVPNSDQCQGVVAAADATIVHEPALDLPADTTHYWRMGVPGWHQAYHYPQDSWQGRPVLGTVGFPFPWKNYGELADVTYRAGWALVLLAPKATDAQIADWTRRNPSILVEREFLDRDLVVSMLTGCDATAFCYTCANTGQSGAVLQGIAARKPVIAFRTCRQFRALAEDPRGEKAILWCETFADVRHVLEGMILSDRPDPATVALAQEDGWDGPDGLGAKYSRLYRQLAGQEAARR